MPYLRTSFQGQSFRAKDLPTLPLALQKARQLADSPNTSVARLAEVIEGDQILSGKVLKIVNSASYGFPGRIVSIQNALALIGFNVIRSLIISSTMFEIVPHGMPELWRHSTGCSIACKKLNHLLQLGNDDEFFIAGLLHDIGKVIIPAQMPEAHEEIVRLTREEDTTSLHAEERVLGVTHQRIGDWLARHWNLPASLHAALAFHHRPPDAKEQMTIASVVHLGDFLTRLFEYGSGGDDHVPLLDPHAFKHLELNQQKLGVIVDAVGETLELGKIYF